MAVGYIKIHRRIMENSLWQERPFTRGQAWIDLILLANGSDGHIWVRGISIKVKRGQVGWSKLRLCERWGWSRGKTDRFLRHLVYEGNIVQQLVQQNKKLTSLITIVKYGEYNPTGQQTGNKTESEQGSINEVNKEKKKKGGKKTGEKREKDKKISMLPLPEIQGISEWFPVKAFEEYLFMRKKMKAPPTEHAQDLLVRKIIKLRGEGHDPEAVVEQSIMNSWKGLFPLKDTEGKNSYSEKAKVPKIAACKDCGTTKWTAYIGNRCGKCHEVEVAKR